MNIENTNHSKEFDIFQFIAAIILIVAAFMMTSFINSL